MSRVAKRIEKFSSQVLYFLILPCFLFFFTIIYHPFEIQDSLDMGSDKFSFNITIITCIVLVSLVISRLIFYFVKRRMTLNYFWYTIWCILEMVAASFFVALYLWLMFKTEVPYFQLLIESIQDLSLVLIFPYLIITLSLIILDYRDDNQKSSSHYDDSVSHIRFCDANGNQKLVLTLNSILYVAAQENYIRIFYINDDKVVSYILRNTMKKLEEGGLPKQLVRCHRSYFVNTRRVKLLKKEKEGVLFAELDAPQPIKIPVTITYYDTVAQLL